MTSRAAPLAVIVALLGALQAGCAQKRVPPPAPARPGSEALVVLLPDPDTRVTGRASVSNAAGSVDLVAPRNATTVTAPGAPVPVTTMTEAEIQRVFGAALAALPAPARHFTLYFLFESNELTAESRALVPEILSVVRQRSVPEVLIVGHTDTMGTPRSNVELGQKRATAVRNLLVQAGLDAATVEVTSHGEKDLLIQTPDATPEPRNRRVEISVR